ncbi:MAG: hypothetical protein JKY96_06790 [Phycisphaerales bacterium]|nr:hypothetical protein [Phycisphaerales bacterium]
MNQGLFSSARCAALVSPFLIAGLAMGDEFDGTVDAENSSAMIAGSSSVHNTGVLIGDFDSKSNPSGTRTIPGLFGGSGNNPIDIDLTGAVDVDLDTIPTGSMMIDVDFDALTIALDGISIDLLGGQSGVAQPGVTMLFSTFHTVAPSFIYPGGIPFDIPIGSGSTIDEAIITQTRPGAGVLIATANPDVFDFAMVVPGELSLAFTLQFDGFDPPAGGIDPIAAPMALTGTIERLGTGDVVLVMSIDPQQNMQDIPIKGVSTAPIPFELPTFGADTAGVLITLTPDLLSTNVDYQWSITVLGTPASCAADLAEPFGVLNLQDVFAYLALFNAQDPAADLASPLGTLNLQDVFAYLALFNAGCP